MTIHAELETIRERVEGATEGPWRVLPESEHRAGAVAAMEGVVADVESPWEHHDAEFIAHARTDLPRVLDAVEKVLDCAQDMEGSAKAVDGVTRAALQGWSRALRTEITRALEGK